MIAIPQDLYDRLIANGKASLIQEQDPVPVVKFFDPCGAATWLIVELDPADPDRLFGLCDLGVGFPELGYVSLDELKSVRGRLGIGLERDLFFTGTYPLSAYVRAANLAAAITDDPASLKQAATALGLQIPRDLPDEGE